ncbi:unnamed protein product [Calypogeia fissa]
MHPMARRNCACGICDCVNHPAACINCINPRLVERYKVLKRLAQQRDSSRRRLDAQLVAKREAELQRHWRAEHAERKTKLREQLRIATLELREAKSKGEQQQRQLDAQTTSLASASSELAVKQVEHLGQYYPDLIRAHSLGLSSVSAELFQKRRMVIRQLCKILPLRRGTGPSDEREKWEASGATQPVRICGVQLPVGDDLASLPALELAASLGYIVQLVNFTARYLSAPLLHSAGFAASSSRVWQRGSYFDPRPAIRSEEYPLFLPRESTTEEIREPGRKTGSSSDLGFSSMDGSRSNVLDTSVHSPRSNSAVGVARETHRDLQIGIKMLRRSVACINAYGYALLALPVPSDMSTFEVFSELLATLVSKEPRGRSSRGSQQPNGRFGLSEGLHLTRLGSCPPNMLEESKPASELLDCPKTSLKGKVNSWNNLLDIEDSQQLDGKLSDSLYEGWDLVEHPTLPPPPSHSEDVEHWTRAMFIDATK